MKISKKSLDSSNKISIIKEMIIKENLKYKCKDCGNEEFRIVATMSGVVILRPIINGRIAYEKETMEDGIEDSCSVVCTKCGEVVPAKDEDKVIREDQELTEEEIENLKKIVKKEKK